MVATIGKQPQAKKGHYGLRLTMSIRINRRRGLPVRDVTRAFPELRRSQISPPTGVRPAVMRLLTGTPLSGAIAGDQSGPPAFD